MSFMSTSGSNGPKRFILHSGCTAASHSKGQRHKPCSLWITRPNSSLTNGSKTPILAIIRIHLWSALQNDLSRTANTVYHLVWKKRRLNNDNDSFIKKKGKDLRRLWDSSLVGCHVSCVEVVLGDKTENWEHLRRLWTSPQSCFWTRVCYVNITQDLTYPKDLTLQSWYNGASTSLLRRSIELLWNALEFIQCVIGHLLLSHFGLVENHI